MKYVFILSGVLFMMFPITVSGGSIDSPAGPGDSGSAMYKIDDIYNRLNSGAAGAKRSGAFAGPVSGPGSASRTLDEVMGIAPAADDTNGAATGNVLSGKTFWGLSSGQWGPQTGGMANNGAFALSCGAGDQGVTAGYYSGGTLTGDADLLTANIRSGVNIFGVAGDSDVVNTGTGDAVAWEILIGKIGWADGSPVTGTMADNGAFALSCGIGDQGVTAGYYSGGTLAGDGDLVGTNIKSSVDIFGVTGTVIESSGDATAGDVLTGKTFSNAGAAGVSGTMANNGAFALSCG
ncbi:MAG: hypothetical protein GY795_17730, partial [Desulfobacterales bacterium]|nr:hypothetical protein [Desulfobacterales bacterium]